jgi:integrase
VTSQPATSSAPRRPRRRASIFPYRGKWRIQYWDGDGKLRTKTAESEGDAYKSLAILEQLIASNSLPKHRSLIPTTGEWLDAWYESRRVEVRPSTLWGFETMIRNHLKPALGDVPLDVLTAQMVEGLYETLRREKNLTEATILKAHCVLNHACKRAVRLGLLQTNPLTYVKAPRRKPVPIIALTLDEVQRVLAVVRTLSAEEQSRWLMALRLGMRQGECLALTFSDIDWDRRSIFVSKTVNTLPGQGIVVGVPKSGLGTRILPLDDETYLALYRLRNERFGAMPNSPLFPSVEGVFREASRDHRAWKPVLKAAGVRSVSLHGARHAAATLLITAGVDVRSVQLLLGHSSPAFTLATYVHPSTEHMRAGLTNVAMLTDPDAQSLEHAPPFELALPQYRKRFE